MLPLKVSIGLTLLFLNRNVCRESSEMSSGKCSGAQNRKKEAKTELQVPKPKIFAQKDYQVHNKTIFSHLFPNLINV